MRFLNFLAAAALPAAALAQKDFATADFCKQSGSRREACCFNAVRRNLKGDVADAAWCYRHFALGKVKFYVQKR